MRVVAFIATLYLCLVSMADAKRYSERTIRKERDGRQNIPHEIAIFLRSSEFTGSSSATILAEMHDLLSADDHPLIHVVEEHLEEPDIIVILVNSLVEHSDTKLLHEIRKEKKLAMADQKVAMEAIMQLVISNENVAAVVAPMNQPLLNPDLSKEEKKELYRDVRFTSYKKVAASDGRIKSPVMHTHKLRE